MKKKIHIVGHIVLGLAAIAAFSAIVMLLWNWLMPAIFGLGVVSFWQALGLLALARILLSGMGRHFFRRGAMIHHRFHNNPIREKWMNMSHEERKEFMKKRHFHHGFDHDRCHEDKE